MKSVRQKILKSAFVHIPRDGVWLEFVTKCSIGNRQRKKPIKFEASLVWRSSNNFGIFAGTRGSFATENEAWEFFKESIAEYGGEIVPMNRKRLQKLENEHNYPAGRHPYLLPEAKL